jgi:phosphomannomutase/phosphoglucomutase
MESPALSSALITGLCASGCSVTDLGVVPTPLCYFASRYLGIPNNIMVTGSHNPPEYNGFKITIKNHSLYDDEIQALRHRIESGNFTGGGETQISTYAIIPAYLADVCDKIRLQRSLRVGIDCGNGTASVIATRLFEALGCEVHPLYCKLDGNFPNHHPDPGNPENLQDLIRHVTRHELDLGLAFDGDADRLGVVDGEGNIIWPDRLMMLYAEEILQRDHGATIIYDIKCSRHLDQLIRSLGGKPRIWRTGHSVMKSRLQQDQGALAGELSGHIYFRDRWYGFDDGLYAGARLLELLSTHRSSPTEIFRALPDSYNTPELAIAFDTQQAAQDFMKDFAAKNPLSDAQRIIDLDGLRAEYADGWYLIRASNTTPSIVIRLEADNISALNRLQAQLRKQIHAVDSTLTVPF